MKKQFLFLAATAVMLSACSTSQPNDESSSTASSSSVSSSMDEGSQSSQISEYSSTEASFSSESIEEESSSEELTWSSMDEAIDFYENMLIVDMGERMAGIDLNGEFYERDAWKLVHDEGNTIVLFKPNIGKGEGGSNIEFVKGEENTEVTSYNADDPYPENPGETRVYRNSDYVLVGRSRSSDYAWGSMDEAIDFYESVYKNPGNEMAREIDWENYDRSAWRLENLVENQIVLQLGEARGIDVSYIRLDRGEEYTRLYEYGEVSSYPRLPSVEYRFQTEDGSLSSTIDYRE